MVLMPKGQTMHFQRLPFWWWEQFCGLSNNSNRLQTLISLSQKCKATSNTFEYLECTDRMLPVDKLNLIRHVTYAQHGKPVSLPLGRKAVRLFDGGVPRKGWEKQMPSCDDQSSGWVCRQHHPARKWAEFYLVFRCKKQMRTTINGKSMKTKIIITDAVYFGKLEVSSLQINWYKVLQHVRMVQLRIAKATWS